MGIISEQAPTNRKAGHDNGNHTHELNENVKTRAGSIFERIAHSIANYSGFMYLSTLSSEVAFLHIFFCIVPSTSGIGHENSQRETC